MFSLYLPRSPRTHGLHAHTHWQKRTLQIRFQIERSIDLWRMSLEIIGYFIHCNRSVVGSFCLLFSNLTPATSLSPVAFRLVSFSSFLSLLERIPNGTDAILYRIVSPRLRCPRSIVVRSTNSLFELIKQKIQKRTARGEREPLKPAEKCAARVAAGMCVSVH